MNNSLNLLKNFSGLKETFDMDKQFNLKQQEMISRTIRNPTMSE